MPQITIRTTITLPAELLKAADKLVRQGRARSRNELLASALRRELAVEERAAIDAAFAAMVEDEDAQDEALRLADEFADSDWEAFKIAEEER